jgi:hypothetical protein
MIRIAYANTFTTAIDLMDPALYTVGIGPCDIFEDAYLAVPTIDTDLFRMASDWCD